MNKLVIKFKALKPKNPKTLLKKEQIMKNVDELYEKYYNAYKNDYDADELSEAKKKIFYYKQFELGDKKDEEPKLITLPKWLSSKNDFNNAIKVFNDLDKLINDIKNKKNYKRK